MKILTYIVAMTILFMVSIKIIDIINTHHCYQEMSYESYAYIQRSLLTKDAISLNFRASCHSKDKILKIVRRGSHFIIKSDLQNFKYKFLNINNGEIKNKQIVGTK